MDYKTLSQKHPLCDADLFRRYDALYRGGKGFKEHLESFLPINPLEDVGTYELRKQQAAYRSYVGPIADFFAAQLFSSPFHVRAGKDGKTEAPDLFYAELREDVDNAGTDLATAMKAWFLTALSKGVAWCLAEKPSEGGVAPESLLDWRKRGLGRVRVLAVAPEDVLDWEVDEAGQMLWAIVHSKKLRRDNPREARTMCTETWKLYDATDVETFSITYDPRKVQLRPDDIIPTLGRKPHDFLQVPLIEMRLPEGLWLLNRTADAQIDHFQLSAAMSWAIKRTCYPVATFQTEEEDVPKVCSGSIIKIGKEESFGWVAPPATSFEVLATQIYAQVLEIYRVAQQMAHGMNASAAALDRSGQSKAADNAATEICLTAYATHVREWIESLFELVSDGRGDIDVKFSIEGMTEFNLDSKTGEVNNIKTALDMAVPSKTFNKELFFGLVNLLMADASQATKDKIREELEEDAAKPEPEPAPAQTSPGVPGQAPAGLVPPIGEKKPVPTAA